MRAMLAEAATVMDGRLEGDDVVFDGVSIDSRSIRRDELFFALTGPNFDGRDFIADARGKGAAGAVVRAPVAEALPQIVVADPRSALGRLGADWRSRQRALVVGITGSNGKTTVKELVAACLAAEAPVLATQGNLNNDLGVPMMLTRIRSGHRYAVLEMGANHPGEIAYLTSLARPDVVLITNAGPAHLEGFGDVEGVARAKGEILGGLRRPELAVLNADDPYVGYWKSLVADVRVVTFGIDADADVMADEIRAGPDGTHLRLHVRAEPPLAVSLPLVGRHNVRNACAAAAVAHALGVPPGQIATALASAAPVGGRLAPLSAPGGVTIYDDSYNANPESVLAAARFLASLPGQSVLVFGDMGELGADRAPIHRELGLALREAGITRLCAVGELSRLTVEAFGDGGRWYDSQAALTAELRNELEPGTHVLVKGSRFMRMERVVEALVAPTDARRKA